MDIDEFLDREFSSLGLPTDKTEKVPEQQIEESYEQSPLFESIKTNLSKGNLEQAEQAYVQLWHILVQQKLKWNKELYEQLSILSREFSGLLSNAYNEVKRKANYIYEQINKGTNALREGKKDLPFKIYSEIDNINDSIPNVFFDEKRIIQEQTMEFYKLLRNTTDNELIKRVSALIQEISRLIDKINMSIRSNDMVNAIVNYNKCIELYNQVPEGFLRYKNSLGTRILEIYKNISIYTEITNLQKQLNSQPNIHGQIATQQIDSSQSTSTKSILLSTKKENAKRNIQKGSYNEALKDIQEALQLEPNDPEAKAINAKIKTLQ